MSTTSSSLENPIEWEPQPEAANIVNAIVKQYLIDFEGADNFASRLLNETGTRFLDWIDHLVLPSKPEMAEQLEKVGFSLTQGEGYQIAQHHQGMFPAILLKENTKTECHLKVDSVADFLFTHKLDGSTKITGPAGSQLRMALFCQNETHQLSVIERHGWNQFSMPQNNTSQIAKALHHFDLFRRRERDLESNESGFNLAKSLIQEAIDDLGTDWTCDLFFEAERQFWQSRNHAARIQKSRQDALGMGWSNHDHHTYRSSREAYQSLIATLEILGFNCRERFYAGAEAGWGAQVLEHPVCGILIFADVDLLAEEVTGDFSHDGLPPLGTTGTIGTWCRLHGEAFLQAGMHHLESLFDCQAAKSQLAKVGVETMAPFTEFSYLWQAFTVGEKWQVSEKRIQAALAEGIIDQKQAEKCRNEGGIGSHLEILERNDGYKGFNQTGINDIILRTDPRRH
ncbi:MAG: hypothetical protein MPJ24_09010 [Pirellulaceae bacterium]|nr:hypothetical protein [Pirellulaceae bacterium]